MPSLVEVLVEKELHPRTSLTRVDGAVELSVDGLTKRITFSCPHPDEDLSRFCVWCARLADSPESGVREIRDRANGGRTLGYIFPITSLAPNSEYAAERLEGRFIRIFASVAALAVAIGGIANGGVVQSFFDLPSEVALRELFSADLAVVVVGRENLNGAGRSEDEIRLLLQEAGYFVADLPQEYAWGRPKPSLEQRTCSIGTASRDLADVYQLLERLVCLAAEQSSAVASLLVYYQVIELLAERLLAARLARLAAAPPAGAWEFREALREAVSESSRVTSLCSQAGVGEDVSAFDRVQRLGAEILRNAGRASEAGAGATLYAVRNVVVHNQVALNAAAHGLLKEFVWSLHEVVFAMIRRFDLAAAR